MITNRLYGSLFKSIRTSRALTYEQALCGIGLPPDDLWIERLKIAEENGKIKSRFFKRLMDYYGVTDEDLKDLTGLSFQHYLRNTDGGRIISFIPDLVAKRNLIMAVPAYSNIKIEEALFQSPYTGSGYFTIGVLLQMWSEEKLRCVCALCGGAVYMFGGLFALSTSNHYGFCVSCRHYSIFKSGNPQFRQNYMDAWSLLLKWRRANKNAESSTVKLMLLDILKDRPDYEKLVEEYHLADNSQECQPACPGQIQCALTFKGMIVKL